VIAQSSLHSFGWLLHGKAEKLVDFTMYMNEIGDTGMAKLAPAFKECKQAAMGAAAG
jgi:hypothetical protein